MNVSFILFYAPIRYKVPQLKNCDFALDKDIGIIEAQGTLFPFVIKSARENSVLQDIAKKQLLKYEGELYMIEQEREAKEVFGVLRDKIQLDHESADILREVALLFEVIGDIKTAKAVMEQALIQRPSGKFIQNKLLEYNKLKGLD